MPLGVLLIGLAAISWGTTGATMMLLRKTTGIDPLLVGWARLAVAAPCLVLAAVSADFVAVGRPAIHARRARAWSALTRREFPSCLLLGLAMAAYQACYFWAVTLTGVAVAALLAICSAPLLIALLAALFLGERPTPTVQLSLGMAVAGTGLLVVGPKGLGQISSHFGLRTSLRRTSGIWFSNAM